MNATGAYRHCETVTRRTAANFYYGIRLLPPRRRKAMCAVYAFARRVDDIGDGSLEREQKLRALDAQARALARLGGAARGGASPPDATDSSPPDGALVGRPDSAQSDPVMVALADTYARFEVPPDALQALIEGVRMDVEGVAYETFDELVLYCRRVAGAIGRACLAIFALRDPDDAGREHAARLADDLGVALQLTNILRDLREDAENGRMYLPAQDLRRFGLIAPGEERDAPALLAELARAAGGELGGARSQAGAQAPARTRDAAGEEGEDELGWLGALVRFEADRARAWFHRGMALTPLLDRRSAACVLAMANIYSRLLDRIEADPQRALGERMALGTHEKAWVAARSMIGGLGGRDR
ncbi:MAG TPA: squalene/phytoene synthase family protein [Solirubrobacteraceae bacterium]|nr:squalene/phytoene synthase family protein [Solirubrobacteraceae bacterium]